MRSLLLCTCLLLALGLGSCMEKRTSDPEKVYRYWSGGEEPPMDVHVVQGRYWESAHWTKEYELYIEIYAPKYWRDAVIRENALRKGEEEPAIDRQAPEWFKPEPNMELLVDKPGEFPGVELYVDSTSGRMLIHVLQL